MEYDFLTWTSFPSSVKVVNPEARHKTEIFAVNIPVTPGATVKAVVNAKTKDVIPYRGNGSWISIMGSPDGVDWKYIDGGFTVPPVPGVRGTKDWQQYESEMRMPADIKLLRLHFTFPKGTTWFDDLKIYQDDKLIYENYFSATPRPLKIVPVLNVTERVVRVYQRIRPGIIKPK